MVLQVRDAHVRRERQGWMGRRNRVFVKNFVIGRVPAVEIVAVPGGVANGAVIEVFARNVGAAGDHVGLADPVIAAAFWNRLAERDHTLAAGDAISRIDAAGVLGAIGESQTS